MTSHAVAPALRTLVAGLVDYAGLFPPAALPMAEAAAAFAAYLDAPEAFMLGRFVVPVARLHELAADANLYAGARPEPWHVSALVGTDPDADAALVAEFNREQVGRLLVDTVEAKTETAAALERVARAFRSQATIYAELSIVSDPRPLLEAVRAFDVRAKVRTGGIVPEAFPSAKQLSRFIATCAELGVPFKATAGLHHPMRAEHALTYASDAPRGTMFGFLNVFAAAAFAHRGMRESELARLLEERDARSLVFGDDGLRWGAHRVSLTQLAETRTSFALAFGSCSFREPVDDLRHLALL